MFVISRAGREKSSCYFLIYISDLTFDWSPEPAANKIIPPRLRHGARIIRSKQVSGPALNSPSHTGLGSGLSSCKTEHNEGAGDTVRIVINVNDNIWPSMTMGRWGQGKISWHVRLLLSILFNNEHVPTCSASMSRSIEVSWRRMFNVLTGYWIDRFYWILTWEMKWSG